MMLLLIDQSDPMPDAGMQQRAMLFAIRRGDQVQIVTDRIGLTGGVVDFDEFRKIVDDRLRKMLDESLRPL